MVRLLRVASTLLLCALLLSPLLLPAQPLRAAPPGQEASLSIFVTIFPELRILPAPNWVAPGLRVTYADASASIAQVEGEEGSGGAGLTQYDVVARDRRVVPIAAKLYLDLGDGRYQANLSYGVASPGGAGEFWLSPQAFRRADELEVEGLLVNRVEYEAAGETWDAIRFDYATDESESAWVFDLASGLLLFSRTSVDTGSHRQQSNRSLVGVRTLEIPWANGRAPRALQAGDSLRLEGVYAAIIDGQPTELPLVSQLEMGTPHTRWTEWSSELFVNGISNGVSPAITGGLQIFGGLWLPPSALAADPPRARIDRDPFTGAEVSYRNDGDFVTLTETGGGYETVMVYDAAGILVAYRSTQEVGVATVVYDLQRVQ
jgi:hypothetical protein